MERSWYHYRNMSERAPPPKKSNPEAERTDALRSTIELDRLAIQSLFAQLYVIRDAHFNGDTRRGDDAIKGSPLGILLRRGKASIGMIAGRLHADPTEVKQQLDYLVEIGLVEIEVTRTGSELYRLKDTPGKSPSELTWQKIWENDNASRGEVDHDGHTDTEAAVELLEMYLAHKQSH